MNKLTPLVLDQDVEMKLANCDNVYYWTQEAVLSSSDFCVHIELQLWTEPMTFNETYSHFFKVVTSGN